MSQPNNTPSTKPMAIPVSQFKHTRARSTSMSSASSSSPDEIPTPISSFPSNHIRANSANSPILSYFLSNPSPTSTFKSKFGGTAPVFEEPEDDDHDVMTKGAAPAIPASLGMNNSIGRRGSLAAPRFPPVSPTAPPSASPPSTERGAGLLRRLSLGNAAFPVLPNAPKSPTAAPPNTAVEGSMPYSSSPDPAVVAATATRRTRRRATVSNAKRAPSPMGERILKGHFDGFN